MKFSASLKLNHIFRRLYRTNGFAGPYLVLYARKNRTGVNRVGITVSKKLGKANIRNRIRRRLREVYRLNEEQFQPGWDIVLVARSKALDAKFTDMEKSCLALAKKAGILAVSEHSNKAPLEGSCQHSLTEGCTPPPLRGTSPERGGMKGIE